MQMTRFVRTFLPFVMLGLAGCFGDGSATPLDPATAKKVGESFKADRLEAKAARQAARQAANSPAKKKRAEAPVKDYGGAGPAAPAAGAGPQEKQ
jgi:hypothetical protein